MALESEILADFQQLLDEHGVAARWKTIDLRVLVSRLRGDQQIDMGGFVESPDLSLQFLFPGQIAWHHIRASVAQGLRAVE